MSTKNWTDRLFILFLVIFGLFYIGAKIHFFTRYFKLGLTGYLEEHWVFWAAMAIVSGILACLSWVKRRAERSGSI
jgi:protein-S-isoprenylcysteine O-methyltransferase Ste14